VFELKRIKIIDKFNKYLNINSIDIIFSLSLNHFVPTIILKDTTLVGNITEKDGFTISGIFKGNIKAEDAILEQESEVVGNIAAEKTAEISGKVLGDVNAERVVLKNTADVKGKLSHKSLIVEEGAKIQIVSSTTKK